MPNLVTVPVGSPTARSPSSTARDGSAQFIADVAGYYLPGTPKATGTFQSRRTGPDPRHPQVSAAGSAADAHGLVHGPRRQRRTTGRCLQPDGNIAAVLRVRDRLRVRYTATQRLQPELRRGQTCQTWSQFAVGPMTARSRCSTGPRASRIHRRPRRVLPPVGSIPTNSDNPAGAAVTHRDCSPGGVKAASCAGNGGAPAVAPCPGALLHSSRSGRLSTWAVAGLLPPGPNRESRRSR